jgi:hypothetical protein
VSNSPEGVITLFEFGITPTLKPLLSLSYLNSPFEEFLISCESFPELIPKKLDASLTVPNLPEGVTTALADHP